MTPTGVPGVTGGRSLSFGVEQPVLQTHHHEQQKRQPRQEQDGDRDHAAPLSVEDAVRVPVEPAGKGVPP